MSASGSDTRLQQSLAIIREARTFSGLTEALLAVLQGYILALGAAFIGGLNVVVDFLLLPFTLGIEIGRVSVRQLILVPLGLTNIGAAITAGELSVFGIFALPVSAVIGLLTVLVFVLFLSWRITGNVPGSFILDNPIVDRLFQTPEEEGDDPD